MCSFNLPKFDILLAENMWQHCMSNCFLFVFLLAMSCVTLTCINFDVLLRHGWELQLKGTNTFVN